MTDEAKKETMDVAAFRQLEGDLITPTNAEYLELFIKMAGRCGGQAIGRTMWKFLWKEDVDDCFLNLWFRTVEAANAFLALVPTSGADFLFGFKEQERKTSEVKATYPEAKDGTSGDGTPSPWMMLRTIYHKPSFGLLVIVGEQPRDVYFDVEAIGFDGTNLINNGNSKDAFLHLRDKTAYALPSLPAAAEAKRNALVRGQINGKTVEETEEAFQERREDVYYSFIDEALCDVCNEDSDFEFFCDLPDHGALKAHIDDYFNRGESP
ncbi:Hypothetical protein POVN_LOCUS439 [uncultured virus]|nr:Hypothetical protein POVN_LOCUS439 [uncultured virus]